MFAVSSADTTAAVAPTPVVTSSGDKLPAYNAYEFSYRSDFGKIILLQQNVETGQEVTQVPTEYHLQQYATTQRQQRVQQLQKLFGGASDGEPKAKTVVVSTGAKTSAPPSGEAAPAASGQAAPSVAPSVVAAATAAHVDIKV